MPCILIVMLKENWNMMRGGQYKTMRARIEDVQYVGRYVPLCLVDGMYWYIYCLPYVYVVYRSIAIDFNNTLGIYCCCCERYFLLLLIYRIRNTIWCTFWVTHMYILCAGLVFFITHV